MSREVHILCAECGTGIHHYCYDAGLHEMKDALISLLSNMRGNGYARIVRTAAGQCIPLDNHDVVEPTR